MTDLINFDAKTGADLISSDTTPGVSFTNTGGGAAIEAVGASAANASISGLQVKTSTASGAVVTLAGTSFVSAVSLVFAAGAGWAGMGAIRIARTDGTFGWVPVLPDGQVTAAAKAA